MNSASQPANRAAKFVDKLNREYNLEVYVAPLWLSPTKRREALTTEEEHVAERINSLVRRLACQGPDVLPGIDEQFNQEARRVCSRWVQKPRAAPNLITVPNAPPKASTTEERRQLRECLLGILLDHLPNPRARRLGCHKRPSDELPLAPDVYIASPNTSPPKRARSALDKVPVVTSSGPRNGTPIPANRSFGFNDGPAPARPPPHHSLNGAPTANHPISPQAITHRPLRQSFSEPTAPTHTAGLHEPARFSPRQGAPAAASRTFGLDGQSIQNQVSANTSITTRHSALFSFPPPDDSDGSQTTIPDDDREEYNDAHFAVDVAFDRPATPARLSGVQAAAAGDSDSSLIFTTPPFTPDEETAMIALDSAISNRGRVGATSALQMQDEIPDDIEFSEATPRRLFDNVGRENGEAKIAIPQRVYNPSVSSTAPTWSTTYDADVDDRLPILGGPPVLDEPPLFSTPLSLEDRLRNSWREKSTTFFPTLPPIPKYKN